MTHNKTKMSKSDQILCYLYSREEASSRDICKDLACASGSITHLKASGYIDRRANGTNEPYTCWITPSGRKKVQEVMQTTDEQSVFSVNEFLILNKLHEKRTYIGELKTALGDQAQNAEQVLERLDKRGYIYKTIQGSYSITPAGKNERLNMWVSRDMNLYEQFILSVLYDKPDGATLEQIIGVAVSENAFPGKSESVIKNRIPVELNSMIRFKWVVINSTCGETTNSKLHDCKKFMLTSEGKSRCKSRGIVPECSLLPAEAEDSVCTDVSKEMLASAMEELKSHGVTDARIRQVCYSAVTAETKQAVVNSRKRKAIELEHAFAKEQDDFKRLMQEKQDILDKMQIQIQELKAGI